VTPTLVSCWFGTEHFARLARVLAFTAGQHCRGWQVDVRLIAPAPAPAIDGTPAYEHNTQKLEHWQRTVEALPDGAPVLLIDADTMIVRPLDDIWARPFDAAYTVRPSSCRLPFNAGVLFLRVGEGTRRLLRLWVAANRRMLQHRPLHQTWRRKYGGMNQAALGYVFESGAVADLAWLALPCQEWNCEDSTWTQCNAVTRIVHVKSALRDGALATGLAQPTLRPLITTWRRLERAAVAAEGLSA
jgi:hypothetical protein